MVVNVMTGDQEEAPALAKPVLVLRRETERPEAVAAGTVKCAQGQDDLFGIVQNIVIEPHASPSASFRRSSTVR